MRGISGDQGDNKRGNVFNGFSGFEVELLGAFGLLADNENFIRQDESEVANTVQRHGMSEIQSSLVNTVKIFWSREINSEN